MRLSDERLGELVVAEADIVPASHLTVVRYEHGGGRVFLDGDAGKRVLVADFYRENEREAWIALRSAAPHLLAEVRALRECERALGRVRDYDPFSRFDGDAEIVYDEFAYRRIVESYQGALDRALAGVRALDQA